jgi:hypothetical protein
MGSASKVTAKRSVEPETDHQVLPFRPRNAGTHARRGPRRPARAGESETPALLRDLAEYERDDSYRHRMTVNLAALLVIIVLSVVGAWLAMQIAELRKKQDCVLSGRSNCAPIELKTPER